jgi:hypothetical protein
MSRELKVQNKYGMRDVSIKFQPWLQVLNSYVSNPMSRKLKVLNYYGLRDVSLKCHPWVQV